MEANSFFKDVVIEGIDLVNGQNRYPGKIFLDVLRAWCIHTPPLLNQLCKQDEDIEQYIIAVHGIKGSTYGICAEKLAKQAEALEAAARSGDREFLNANNEPFINAAQALLSRLEQFLAGCAANMGDKPSAPAPDAALLSALLDACKHFKSSLMEEILDKLESFQYESGGDLIVWLREQMDNLEYDAIKDCLEQ